MKNITISQELLGLGLHQAISVAGSTQMGSFLIQEQMDYFLNAKMTYLHLRDI